MIYSDFATKYSLFAEELRQTCLRCFNPSGVYPLEENDESREDLLRISEATREAFSRLKEDVSAAKFCALLIHSKESFEQRTEYSNLSWIALEQFILNADPKIAEPAIACQSAISFFNTLCTVQELFDLYISFSRTHFSRDFDQNALDRSDAQRECEKWDSLEKDLYQLINEFGNEDRDPDEDAGKVFEKIDSCKELMTQRRKLFHEIINAIHSSQQASYSDFFNSLSTEDDLD